MARGAKTAYGERQKAPGFRRTWDAEAYDRKAQDRAKQEQEQDDNDERRRKGLAPRAPRTPWVQRDLLQARAGPVNLDAMVGKTQIVQAATAAAGQPGFYCKVCDVTVKDSLSYLDHINGKKHQRVLNRSMDVAIETVDDVRAKLESLRQAARRRQHAQAADYNFHEKVRVQQEIEARKKQKRREARRRHRQAKAAADPAGNNNDSGDADDDGGADEMAAVMGFGAFGTSKK
ncbi:U4/U6.U5 snRNP associated protein [Coemansia javaensis]|uniref:U4/U6.U5 snRNP associated protein n=1 Tax=Coemansia javaensis TaxID=2761396 RepID=A0A9W8H6R9_9FUNG|nr:U4/U6.U5 snRNP associated protein [Coemansia javaensis]